MLFFLQILTEHLRSKMTANAREVESGCHVSAVVSSLAITVLVHKYAIELKNVEVVSLLSCLALEVDPSGDSCTVFEEVLREFSPDVRK